MCGAAPTRTSGASPPRAAPRHTCTRERSAAARRPVAHIQRCVLHRSAVARYAPIRPAPPDAPLRPATPRYASLRPVAHRCGPLRPATFRYAVPLSSVSFPVCRVSFSLSLSLSLSLSFLLLSLSRSPVSLSLSLSLYISLCSSLALPSHRSLSLYGSPPLVHRSYSLALSISRSLPR